MPTIVYNHLFRAGYSLAAGENSRRAPVWVGPTYGHDRFVTAAIPDPLPWAQAWDRGHQAGSVARWCGIALLGHRA